jgi:hypothetical protein
MGQIALIEATLSLGVVLKEGAGKTGPYFTFVV